MNRETAVSVQTQNQSQHLPENIRRLEKTLEHLEKEVVRAKKAAKESLAEARDVAIEKVGWFNKGDMIESLQKAVENLAETQSKQAEIQTISFIYQRKLGEITHALFELGLSDIATVRMMVNSLEQKMSGDEELDELTKREMRKVMWQLHQRQDFMQRQEQIEDRIIELAVTCTRLEEMMRHRPDADGTIVARSGGHIDVWIGRAALIVACAALIITIIRL